MDHNDFLKGTFDPFIGHEIIEIKPKYIKSSLEVEEHHKQPMGKDIGESDAPINKKWRYPIPSDGHYAQLKLVCKHVRRN